MLEKEVCLLERKGGVKLSPWRTGSVVSRDRMFMAEGPSVASY